MGQGLLTDLAAAAYSCVFEEQDWIAWLRRLTHELGGVGGVFFVLDQNKATTDNVAGCWGETEKLYDEYMAEWSVLDPHVGTAMSVDRASVYVDTQHIDFGAPDIARYMNWQMGRGGIKHTMAAVTLLGRETHRVGLSIHRASHAGCTPPTEHRKLAAIFPEISGAPQLGFRHAELLQNAFWDGVVAGEPGKAAVLLDEYGRLMRHTDAAYRLLVVEDGLRLARARLCAHGKVDDDALQAMLARCIQPIAPRAGTVRLRRPSGKQGLIVTCFPVARQLRMVAPAEAAAIVTIVDPTAAPAPRAERIRLAFDVTRREAEMAAALLAGHSVESAAAAMEIGLPTARTYMRKLYEKTQAHGQTALLRLLSRIY